jgi:hypothetical protein
MLEILFNGLLIHSLVLFSYLAFTLPLRLLELTLLVVYHLTFLKGFSSQNTCALNSLCRNIRSAEGAVYFRGVKNSYS